MTRAAGFFTVTSLLVTACSATEDLQGGEPPADPVRQDAAAVALDSDDEITSRTPADGIQTEVADLPALEPIAEVGASYGWERAGASRTLPTRVLSVVDFGAVANDGEPDSDAFYDALEEARGGAVVDVPVGDFLLTDQLVLTSGVVLRGGGLSTRLLFDLDGEGSSPVWASGSPATDWQPVAADISVAEVTVQIADTSGISVGDVVELEQDNDAEAMYTREEWDVDWAEGSVGELAEVVAVSPTEVTLAGGVRSDYSLERAVRVRTIDTVANVGIESLTIKRLDDGYASTMGFSYAQDVWISDVESIRTTRAHAAFDRVLNCEVSGSTLHGANDFGDGGRAYGVSIGHHTTGCLIVNNALFDLRHALIIQLGASGNVFAYNHARGSAGYEDRQPRADISIHGHWPQANLFEGNIVDRVMFGDWWGPAGPANTLFRNCVLDFVTIEDQSHDQLVVANSIGDGGFAVDNDIEGLVEAGNSINGGSVDPAIQSFDVPASLWTEGAPDFLDGFSWPPLETQQQCDLPASARSPLGNK